MKLNTRDQTAAKTAVVHPGDLPRGWIISRAANPVDLRSFCAKRSDLVVTGEAQGSARIETNAGDVANITTVALVFQTPRMAASSFQRATLRYQTCELKDNSHLKVIADPAPHLAELARAFRVSFGIEAFSVLQSDNEEVIEITRGRTRLTVEEDSVSFDHTAIRATVLNLAQRLLSRVPTS